MSVLALILVVVFMIINLVIYHKIFTVTYFNLGKGCFQELFFAWLVAMLEMGFVVTIGKNIFGALFKLLGFVGKLFLILLVIAFVAFIVWKLTQFLKGKVDGETIKDNISNFTQNNENMTSQETQSHMEMDGSTDTKDNVTEADIELTEANQEKSTGINNVRRTAESNLEKVKDFVDNAPKMVKESVFKQKTEEIKAKAESEDVKDTQKKMICRSCGKLIDREAKFCIFCGKEIKDDIEMDTDVCFNCGKELSIGSNFCHYCGTKVKC